MRPRSCNSFFNYNGRVKEFSVEKGVGGSVRTGSEMPVADRSRCCEGESSGAVAIQPNCLG
jgi:hypothetical protein